MCAQGQAPAATGAPRPLGTSFAWLAGFRAHAAELAVLVLLAYWNALDEMQLQSGQNSAGFCDLLFWAGP